MAAVADGRRGGRAEAAVLGGVIVVGWPVVCSVRSEFICRADGGFTVLSQLVAVWVVDCHGDISLMTLCSRSLSCAGIRKVIRG